VLGYVFILERPVSSMLKKHKLILFLEYECSSLLKLFDNSVAFKSVCYITNTTKRVHITQVLDK